MSWDGYIALGSSSDARTFVELTSTGYQRQRIGFNDVSNGRLQGVEQSARIDFTTTDLPETTVNAFGFFTAATGGSAVFIYPVTNRQFAAGKGYAFHASSLGLVLADWMTVHGTRYATDPSPLTGLPAQPSASGTTGSGSNVLATSPTLTTPVVLGSLQVGDPATQNALIVTPSSPAASGPITFSHSGAGINSVNHFNVLGGMTWGDPAINNAITFQPGGGTANTANFYTASAGMRFYSNTTVSGYTFGNITLANYISLNPGSTPTSPAAINSLWGIVLTLGSGRIVGITDGTNVGGGGVGELISANVAGGSALSLTTNVALDVTSISLTAGDWDVQASAWFAGSPTTLSLCESWISATSATRPTPPAANAITSTPTTAVGSVSCGPTRVSISATTPYLLTAKATFGGGTCTVYGFISARRRR